MKFWMGLVFVLVLWVQPLAASEPAVDTLPPELVRLRDEGRLTVRALWAWQLVPELTPAMALEFRGLGFDLLSADQTQIRSWLDQGEAGQIQFSGTQRDLLEALAAWMEPDLEPPAVSGQEAQTTVEAETAPPGVAEIVPEQPFSLDTESSEQDLTPEPIASPVAQEDVQTDQTASGTIESVALPQSSDALYRGNPARTGIVAGTAPQQTPNLVWKRELTAEPCRDPVVFEDTVYIGCMDGHLYALDLAAGALKWKFQAGDWVDQPPAVFAGTVYFGDVMGDRSGDRHLFAVDALSGVEKWRFKSQYYGVNSSPAIVGGTVYFGAGDQHLYALDALTGEKTWSFRGEDSVGTPAIAGGTAFFAHGNRLTAVELGADEEKWTFRTQARISTCPVVADGVVYAGIADDFHLYAVDAHSGREIWKFGTGLIHQPPAVRDGVVHIAGIDNLYALDAQSGTLKWTISTERERLTAPVIVGETILVGAGRFLLALDSADGREKWRFEAGDKITAPALSDGTIYFWSEDGRFYAVR